MALAPFLAMTAAEIRNCVALPSKIAWLSCHFSPYGTGLSNLPRSLPPGSLLILDDSNPMEAHNPERIGEQLSGCIQALHCAGVLLDFQRPGLDNQRTLAEYLVQLLPCPVAVSEDYAVGLHSPVFLPPTPPSVPLKDYLKEWQNREIWLELALSCELLKLTEKGCEICSTDLTFAEGFADDSLHCHYQIEDKDKCLQFTLWRTEDDLSSFLEEVKDSGTVEVIGLYQELHQIQPLLYQRKEPGR